MPDAQGRLFADEIAARLGIAASDWRARVSRGHAPKPAGWVVIGGRARSCWDGEAVEEYIAKAPRRGPRRKSETP
jgi:predicted DNA-binding transcriptional regulator AlpA